MANATELAEATKLSSNIRFAIRWEHQKAISFIFRPEVKVSQLLLKHTLCPVNIDL